MRVIHSVFFLPRASEKCPCKPFFAIFSIFARALFDFHAHFLPHFSLFSRPLFFSWALFWFFSTGSKIVCTGRNLTFLRALVLFSRTYFLFFCTRTHFSCTGMILEKMHGQICFFTGTFFGFFSFFHGHFFLHGHNFSFFARAEF